MLALLFFLGVLIGLTIFIIAIYNKLIRLRNTVKSSWSDIDVQLKKRYDFVPNLVETVKGYASHERSLFEKVTEARSMAMRASSPVDKAKAENTLTDTLKSLFAVAEAYPELKATTNFLQLQTQLKELEDSIEYARRYYNAVVRDYNIMIESFPSNMGTALGLEIRTHDDPRPGPGQVCMRVRATALNFVDLVFLSGAVPGVAGLVPLIDGAGEVGAVGAGLTTVAVGDRVIANPHQSWLAGELSPESSGVYLGGTVNGMLAEYAVLPEHGVVRMPAHLTFEEAAALPCAGMSAWSSVTGGARRLGVIPGETVLIQGTGGVSLFALEFATLLF